MASNNNMSQMSDIMPLGKHKLVLLGDQSVGKSSILNKFVYNVFDESSHPTVGIDFISKTLELEGGRKVRMQLWDTAGQERFRTLIPNYIRGSSVAVVVFDVADKITFANVGRWVQDVKNERNNDTIMVLVANKVDLEESRQITGQQIQEIKEQLEFNLAIEVSAKTGQGLSSLFHQVAALLPNNDMSQVLTQSNILNNDQVQQKKNVILTNQKSQQAQNQKKKCC